MSDFVVGVDIDGVLGDQVAGVLPRIQERFNVELRHEDVVDWRLPIGDDWDIAREIEAALLDPAFVLAMPVRDGAREMVNSLRELGVSVAAVTARPSEALGATAEWLANNGLAVDEILVALEAKKGAHGTQVLVDDYIGNVLEFVSSTSGTAILVEQPWNQDRRELDALFSNGRVLAVVDLREVVGIVERVNGGVLGSCP